MLKRDKGLDSVNNEGPSSSLNEEDPLLGNKGDEKGKRNASSWHVIIPLFFLTIGMGAMMAPMVQWYQDIFCDRYYQSRTVNSGLGILSWMMDNYDGDIPDVKDCAIPEVQAIVSKIQAILLFVDSASTFLMASFYGSLSDRHGRRLVFRIFSLGGILTMLCYITVANFQNWVGVTPLIVAPLAHGLLAGDVIVVAAVQAYISDCTTPETRTVAFGRMVASALAGAVFGPTIASILILKTGSVVCVFYLMSIIYVGFYIYITWFMPESLDENAMKRARRKASEEQDSNLWKKLNLFSALSILSKTKPRHINRYAVPILASIQFVMATIAQPPVLLYAMLKFKWTAYEGGLLASVMSLIRFLVITVVLPWILIKLQSYWQESDKVEHRILFDSYMIRVGLGIGACSWLMAGLVTTEHGFTIALVCECWAILSQPSIRSLYTTLVDPSEVGALCGAQAVIESIATMIAIVGINFIYSASVKTMPSLFLYMCAGLSALGCLLAFLIHPVEDQSDSPPA
ncbi:major facilitator superfamily domain-containing protein [Chlamydoabsidia padenii]|nr:major facilitator superfamily domain-containing protein [Chlamydoabsidia padenii]